MRVVEPFQVVLMDRGAGHRVERHPRFFEGQTTPDFELLEQERDLPVLLRKRGRPPFAPLRRTPIEKQPLDDDRQIGPQAASAFELPEHRIIVFDQLQVDVCGEFFEFVCRQAAPPSDERNDGPDRVQMVEE